MAKIISVAYGQNLVSTFYFVKDFFLMFYIRLLTFCPQKAFLVPFNLSFFFAKLHLKPS